MTVSQEMRTVEDEIENAIRSMKIWKHSRDVLLRSLIEHYRDGIEHIHSIAAIALQHQEEFLFRLARKEEQDIRSGVFRALLWAMDFCSERGTTESPPHSTIEEIVDIGRNYDVVVDFLKVGERDLVQIVVNRDRKVVEIYEGGELTGCDRQLIDHQQETSGFYTHTALTHDKDQLTSRWSAGAFRSCLQRLAKWALESTDTICQNLAGNVVPLMPRPAVLEVPKALDATEEAVLDDLTLNPEKVRGPWKWRLYTWLDIPLVLVGGKRLAMSDILITLGTLAWHDYMLRIAARVDSDQYSKVSQLREDRMMEICRSELGVKGWNVRTGFEIPGPPKRQIDVFA
jgi:hypothetical protein